MGDLAFLAMLMGGFWGFNQARAPLPERHFPDETRAEQCGECHTLQYDQWRSSRHARAWNNEIFQDGFAKEPRTFCVHCHAPTASNPYELRRKSASIQDEGVSCRVCHVRDGKIASARTEWSPHDSVARPELATSRFCAHCHEFNFVKESPKGPKVTDLVMQTTYSEWLAYREAGGEETCQSCHMPNGDHTFVGVHRPNPLMHAIEVECHDHRLKIKNTGVGHAIPTGDVFRAFEVEFRTEDDGWNDLTVFHKEYAVDVVNGQARKYIAKDSRIGPAASAKIELPQSTSQLRFRLHYSKDRSKVIATYTMTPDGNCKRLK